jgi:membrane associated rhomboid family serine protease
MLIPIGTDLRPRHAPIANYMLVALNVLVFLFTDVGGGRLGQELKIFFSLDGARPALHQYLSYQFLHGDMWHLAGNMLFLWIFGNAVCDRMGTVAYLLFYLAGGVFAGIAFAAEADNPMIGASGAIAAVTTAFLALFPRIHVTLLVWMFFIFTFRVPAMILIIFKIILWDNIIAPGIDQGAYSSVAVSAHLGGYLFGFVISMALLGVRALPRNQFDMVALWDRWRRRSGLVPSGGGPGRPLTARPIMAREIGSRPLESVPLTPIEKLRDAVATALAEREYETAATAYTKLMELDNQQVLARPQQLEIANYLAQSQHYPAAARAYEAFLTAYPGAADAGQVLLFLGLIYSRHLADDTRAAAHLRAAQRILHQDAQRNLADDELRTIQARLDAAGQTPDTINDP